MTDTRIIAIHRHPHAGPRPQVDAMSIARRPDADAPESPARRALLGLMAASAALAGAGCSGPPQETIVPYVDMPEGAPSGEPVYYASAVVRDGYAHGVLVQTHDGRPTKIEGNPLHAMSGGASDIHSQAAILQMWDPDRSRAIAFDGRIADWDALRAALAQRRAPWDIDGGRGLRVLTGTVTSPTMLRQIQVLQQRYPAMKWHRHDPLHDGAAQAGMQDALGLAATPFYHLDRARVIVSAGADLLGQGPAATRHARDFAKARRDLRTRPRLYVLETMPGLTGAMADDRRALAPDEMAAVVERLAHALGVTGANTDAVGPNPRDARANVGGGGGGGGGVETRDGATSENNAGSADNEAGAIEGVTTGARVEAWEAALAQALRDNAGRSLLVTGPAMPARIHALAWEVNRKLGNVGRTVDAVPAPSPRALRELVDDLRARRVDTLVMIDTNPVYDAPGELGFDAALRDAGRSLHMGLYQDETGRAASWHIPRAHDFEDWSDARAADGTAGIVQPVISPLHGGRSPHVLLRLLADGMESSAHDEVRQTWRAQWQAGADFERHWRDALRKGFIADSAQHVATASAPVTEAAGTAKASVSARAPTSSHDEATYDGRAPSSSTASTLQALFAEDASTGAGAWANNAWLQELPRPLSRMTWDNAAYMAERTALALGLVTGDVVTLTGRKASIDAPVFVIAGHAENCVTLPLGYGRSAAGRVGNGVGFDAYPLQEFDEAGRPSPLARVSVRRTGRRHEFARVQTEMSTHGRDLIRIEDLRENAAASKARADAPHAAGPGRPADTLPQRPTQRSVGLKAEERHGQPSLYPPVEYPDYAWAMTIDLDTCIGCNTCTVACQAENNIPVVGKDQVARGREMHWIRVDTYHDEHERTLFQPVPCMHCENAPCELVCPVGATVHDSEGLNAQVYNRCVGTRFCSNNCPYKVRRFNFYQYSDDSEDSAAHQNPDVTVRQRGVMEKCTYCVQRISRARIEAEKQGRPIRDGDVVTACQAACPTQAIVFGDINDPASRVSQAKRSPRGYALLEEMNTRPRTTYQARLEDSAARLEPADE